MLFNSVSCIVESDRFIVVSLFGTDFIASNDKYIKMNI